MGSRLDGLSYEARHGLDDLFYFGSYYWGLQLEEKPHRWMCDELMKTLTMAETPHVIMDVPRGCYKTSIAIAGAVWQYLRQLYIYDNPYHRLLYASNTLALGEQFLHAIEAILRAGGNEGRIDEDYEPLWHTPTRENRKSSSQDAGIYLKPRMERGEIASVREPNFFIASIGALPIGFHADGAILDDLNNKKNVSTDQQLKKTHEFYRQIYPIIHTHDRTGSPAHIWMNCTPWHDMDVRGMIIDEEKQKKLEDPSYVSPWRVVKATAHMQDGSLFFPTKLSEHRLELLSRAMGEEYWAAYEGSPVTPTNSIARQDQIRYKPREEFPSLHFCRITLDPNQHSDARLLGCYAAMVIGGYDNLGRLWILDARGGRDWDAGKMIEELYRVQNEFPNFTIFIEDEHMRHFDHAVNLEFVNRMHRAEETGEEVHRLRLNYVPAPRNLTKYERWQGSLKPRFQSGQIFFAQEIPISIKAEIENELLRGPASKFKDFLDALAMMEIGIVPRFRQPGSENVIPFRTDQEIGGTHRRPTFGDAFGAEMFGE